MYIKDGKTVRVVLGKNQPNKYNSPVYINVLGTKKVGLPKIDNSEGLLSTLIK